MKISEPLDIDHADRHELYDYVERHGAVEPDEVQKAVFPNDRRCFVHHLAVLKRDGYVEEVDGKLRVALDTGAEAEEEFSTDEFDFSIRPARQEDIGGVVGAIRQVVEDRRYIVAETVAEAIDHDQALVRHNEVESRVFFVAVVDGDVVGWAHLNAPELEKLRHTAEITFGVIEDYRSHGIGSHLFSRAVEWARANGYEKIYQSIPATNEEAVEFLKERGCEVEAVRKDHYKIDGEYVDEVMLALDVT